MAVTVEPFGGASESVVAEFEQRNHIMLPTDYAEFLIKNNGGLLVASECLIENLNDGVLVEVLLGLNLQEQTVNCDYWLNMYHSEMPAGFIVIALGATGMFILGTSKPAAGVYFWDDAHAFSGSSEEDGNTYWIADTFSEFLGSLKLASG